MILFGWEMRLAASGLKEPVDERYMVKRHFEGELERHKNRDGRDIVVDILKTRQEYWGKKDPYGL